jgi:hypothetical protein
VHLLGKRSTTALRPQPLPGVSRGMGEGEAEGLGPGQVGSTRASSGLPGEGTKGQGKEYRGGARPFLFLGTL